MVDARLLLFLTLTKLTGHFCANVNVDVELLLVTENAGSTDARTYAHENHFCTLLASLTSASNSEREICTASMADYFHDLQSRDLKQQILEYVLAAAFSKLSILAAVSVVKNFKRHGYVLDIMIKEIDLPLVMSSVTLDDPVFADGSTAIILGDYLKIQQRKRMHLEECIFHRNTSTSLVIIKYANEVLKGLKDTTCPCRLILKRTDDLSTQVGATLDEHILKQTIHSTCVSKPPKRTEKNKNNTDYIKVEEDYRIESSSFALYRDTILKLSRRLLAIPGRICTLNSENAIIDVFFGKDSFCNEWDDDIKRDLFHYFANIWGANEIRGCTMVEEFIELNKVIKGLRLSQKLAIDVFTAAKKNRRSIVQVTRWLSLALTLEKTYGRRKILSAYLKITGKKSLGEFLTDLLAGDYWEMMKRTGSWDKKQSLDEALLPLVEERKNWTKTTLYHTYLKALMLFKDPENELYNDNCEESAVLRFVDKIFVTIVNRVWREQEKFLLVKFLMDLKKGNRDESNPPCALINYFHSLIKALKRARWSPINVLAFLESAVMMKVPYNAVVKCIELHNELTRSYGDFSLVTFFASSTNTNARTPTRDLRLKLLAHHNVCDNRSLLRSTEETGLLKLFSEMTKEEDARIAGHFKGDPYEGDNDHDHHDHDSDQLSDLAESIREALSESDLADDSSNLAD